MLKKNIIFIALLALIELASCNTPNDDDPNLGIVDVSNDEYNFDIT